MLKIRLQRVGRKHEPAFRLVLTDSQNSTKSGLFKEILGSYDPRKEVDQINADRVKYWISQGAIPTDTVHNLLINHKIIEGKKRNVLSKKTPQIKEVKEEAPAPEAPVDTTAETAPVETPEEVPVTPAPAPVSEAVEVPTEEGAPVEESAPTEAPTETA